MAAPTVVILMSDSGHDPTETAVPYSAFKEAGFIVHFATESGKSPACDNRMLEGITGKLLGAKAADIKLYKQMIASEECQHPLSWTAPGFSLNAFNLVLLPGGHEKSVRQILDSQTVHKLLGEYFPQTKKPSDKAVGAICHGVMVLANSKDAEGKSVLRECATTALPGVFESGIFWATRLFLGSYYKTYGAGSENVEAFVRKSLDDPDKQFKSSVSPQPFVVADENYNYVSARFPPDAEMFAKTMVDIVKGSM